MTLRGAFQFAGRGALVVAMTGLSACRGGPVVPVVPASSSSDIGSRPATAHKRVAATQTTIFSGFSNPAAVAVGGSNAYVTDRSNHALEKVASDGTISVVSNAFRAVSGVAVTAQGLAYVADTGRHKIFEVTPSGTLTPFFSDAALTIGLALDGFGNLYVADGRPDIKKVAPDGTVTFLGHKHFGSPNCVTVDSAGDVYAGDAGAMSVKELKPDGSIFKIRLRGYLRYIEPVGVAVDSSGSLYVADNEYRTALKIVHRSASTLWQFPHFVAGIAVGADDSVYVLGNRALYKIDIDGTSGILGRGPPEAVAADKSGNAYVAAVDLYKVSNTGKVAQIEALPSGWIPPSGVAVDSNGNVYAVENEHLYKIPPNGSPEPFGPEIDYPSAVATDRANNVYVSDTAYDRIEEFSPQGVEIQSWSDVRAFGIAVDAEGNLYVACYYCTRVVEFLKDGRVRQLGSGLEYPTGVAVDAASNVYVTDYQKNVVFRIRDGKTTIVGSGFRHPLGVAVDGLGNLYVADYGHGMVKKLTP